MIRRAVLPTLLTAMLVSPGMAGTAVAAPRGVRGVTAPVADPLVVEQITPQVTREADTAITISGVVTGTPFTPVRVRLHYSPRQPFRFRSDMRNFVAEQGYSTSSYSTKIQATPLDAAGTLPFSFTVTPGELGMSRLGVYPFAVEVLDATTGQRIAIERTFLPYMPQGAQIPKVGLALALPIVDRPHRADDATFMDDDLRASISSGRLANLLKLVGQTDKSVTWFVDPSLMEDVRQTGTGKYTVKTRAGSEEKATDLAARRWLEGLGTALAGKPVIAMPYADPDVAALVHNGLDTATAEAIKRGADVASKVLGRDIKSTTTWPAGGVIDRDALDELATAGVRTVLLSGDALPPDPPSATTPASAADLESVSGRLTALLTDPALNETLDANVSTPGSALLAQQRFIAETAMIAFEQPEQPGQPKQPSRTVIAAPSNRLWNPDPAFLSGLLDAASSTPWLRMTSLASVKPGRTQVPRSDLVYTDRDRQAELGRSQLNTVKKLNQRADVTAAATIKHARLFDGAVLRLMSASWRGDARKAAAFVKQVSTSVDARTDKVSVIGNPRGLAGANGEVPISVDNALGEDISIKIRVTSDDTSRLAVDAPAGVYETESITVAADRSLLVNVPVTVLGEGGETTISVQLITADGRPYGDRVRVTVRATGYTGVALIIVGAALTIMLAAVIMRILRRRSRKAFPFGGAEPPAEDPIPVPGEVGGAAEHGEPGEREETPHS